MMKWKSKLQTIAAVWLASLSFANVAHAQLGFTAPSGTYSIDYLVVGGGAGSSQGGGGGGEFKTGSIVVARGQVITVTVGPGGAGSPSAATRGSDGADSILSAPIGITAKGG